MLSTNSEQTRRKPNAVDAHVGQRIRQRREWQNMSQTTLGEAIGVTFQQVQKYEKGVNRVGAGRLQQISKALKVEPSYFFEDTLNKSGRRSGPLQIRLTSHPKSLNSL